MEGLYVPQGHNRHHLFWEKSNYSGRLRRTFRNFPGNVIPTPVPQHNQLHRELGPPLIPTKHQMLDSMDILRDTEPHGFTWGAIALQRYFENEAFELTSCEESMRALKISDHIRSQLGYLTLQKVE